MKSKMTEWLIFNKLPSAGKKTETFEVLPNQSSGNLGEIRWYANWRRYVFFPKNNCLFDASCLREIADFIKAMMDERKGIRKSEKQNNS